MGSQSRHNQAMDAQTRQALALERIADAVEKFTAWWMDGKQSPEPYEPSDEPPPEYVDQENHNGE